MAVTDAIAMFSLALGLRFGSLPLITLVHSFPLTRSLFVHCWHRSNETSLPCIIHCTGIRSEIVVGVSHYYNDCSARLYASAHSHCMNWGKKGNWTVCIGKYHTVVANTLIVIWVMSNISNEKRRFQCAVYYVYTSIWLDLLAPQWAQMIVCCRFTIRWFNNIVWNMAHRNIRSIDSQTFSGQMWTGTPNTRN